MNTTEVNPSPCHERPLDAASPSFDAPIEPVCGRTRVLQLLRDQKELQGARVFKEIAARHNLQLQALATGAECVVAGFEPAIDRYPTGDFVKAIPLETGKLLLVLVDFPGKGVLPSLDKTEKRILSENSCVAQKVVLLHRLLERGTLTASHIRNMVHTDRSLSEKMLNIGYHRCGQGAKACLENLDIMQMSTLFETLILPVLPDSMLAAAFVLLDPMTGKGQYLSRGHSLPIVIVRNEPTKRSLGTRKISTRTELLVNSNLPLGFPGMLPPNSFTLEPGEHLIVFSDGLGEARLSTRSAHYPKFEEAVIEATRADTEPGFFDNILDLAPDALFCPEGYKPLDLFPRLLELIDIFARRDDTAVLAYTQKPFSQDNRI